MVKHLSHKRNLEKDDSEISAYQEMTIGMLSDHEKVNEEREILKINLTFELKSKKKFAYIFAFL